MTMYAGAARVRLVQSQGIKAGLPPARVLMPEPQIHAINEDGESICGLRGLAFADDPPLPWTSGTIGGCSECSVLMENRA